MEPEAGAFCELPENLHEEVALFPLQNQTLRVDVDEARR